jgi:hypothetical protein
MSNLQGDHDHESRHNGYPLVDKDIVTTIAQTTAKDGGVVIEENNTLVQTSDDDCGVRIALDGQTLWFEVGTRGRDFQDKAGKQRAYARGNLDPENARMLADALEEAADRVEQHQQEGYTHEPKIERKSLLTRLQETVVGKNE